MRFFIFLTFNILLSFFAYSQSYNEKDIKKKAYTAFREKNYDLSIKYFKLIESKTTDKKTRSYCQHVLGHLYGKEKLNLDLGIYWLKKNINTIDHDPDNRYFTHVTSHSLLGEYYLFLGKRDSAELYLKKGSSIYLNNIEKYKTSYPILRQLNTFFYRRQEYNLSKDILDHLLNIHVNYSTLSDYLSLCIQVDDIDCITNSLVEIDNLNEGNFGHHFYQIGNYYFENSNYIDAIKNFKKYLFKYNFQFKLNDDYVFSNDEIILRHYFIARTYLKIAQCYRELNDPSNQIIYLNKAEKEIKKGLSFPTQDMNVMAAEIYRAIEIYNHENNITTSINYLDSAQNLIDHQIKIHKKDTNQVLLNQLMLQNFYTAEYSNNHTDKEHYYWQAYLMFKKFIGNQYNDDDQLYQFKSIKEIQDQLVSFYSNLYLESRENKYLFKVLEIVENSKSNILYKRSLGLDNLSFEEYINTKNIDSLKNQINSSPLLTEIEIKNYFHKFYEDKGFVSYYPVGKSMVMVGFIDDHFFLEKRNLPENWNELVNQTYKEVSNSNLFINRSFNHQLFQLGNFLLPSSLRFSDVQRVVFSPSGNLTFIPFEILKVRKGYYLENWAISYSFSLHHEYSSSISASTDYEEINILGVAPYNNINLPFSLEEVKSITTNFISDKEATMSNTLEKINNSNILHLATHTTINKTAKDSHIEFYPLDTNKVHTLSFNEIANKDLSHLKLVSLSSCHSADGPYIDGEGTLSLQRAFAYANVDAVLASKWDVNDEVSSIIMASFYEYLEEGWEKDIALQKAKKDFWKNNPSIKVNPIYWGNIVLYGEAEAITSPSFQKTLFQYLPFDF